MTVQRVARRLNRCDACWRRYAVAYTVSRDHPVPDTERALRVSATFHLCDTCDRPDVDDDLLDLLAAPVRPLTRERVRDIVRRAG